uniref:RdRp n=1 Tax=viral metagenome TaxID=1070528 RepID=A0A2V0RK13_9ZZZZ
MNLSNKAGPNGPATLSAYADVRPLEEDADLYEAVKSKLQLTKPKIDLDIHARRKIKGNFNHSKLVFLPDKSGKTRVIAIGDWWSNLALTDLHLAFMSGLKKLQGDCTYVQDKIPKLIKRMGPNLFSSDMSAFTDRFPIEIEEAIVKSRYGEEIGVLWRRILQRKFPSKDGYIQYKVGNPMGLLSSWAVSSFTHHYIKWWCRRKHPEVKGYKSLVLGDDSLCNNEDVYNTYLTVIKELGVSISHDKCSVSKDGYAEFAKRLFTPSGEITGIPVDILKGVRHDPSLFIELVKIMRSRGYKDEHIAPGVQSLLLSMPKKVMMTVLFVLSSSEDYTGMPPLVIGEGGALLVDPPVYGGLSEDSMKSHIEQAQREIFWREVDDKIHGEGSSPPTESPKQRSQMNIPKCHPAYADIQTGIYQYMYHGDGYNEFSIFEAWQQNKDFDLVNIPSMNPYKYTIRNQRVSEARYNVLKKARAFALGFQEYSTEVPMKISNSYLFHLAFARMNE